MIGCFVGQKTLLFFLVRIKSPTTQEYMFHAVIATLTPNAKSRMILPFTRPKVTQK